VLSMTEELTLRQARDMLATWAADLTTVLARREPVIRSAIAAGVSKSEAHRITGLARNTIDRIVSEAS
jgi:hypothetical protein